MSLALLKAPCGLVYRSRYPLGLCRGSSSPRKARHGWEPLFRQWRPEFVCGKDLRPRKNFGGAQATFCTTSCSFAPAARAESMRPVYICASTASFHMASKAHSRMFLAGVWPAYHHISSAGLAWIQPLALELMPTVPARLREVTGPASLMMATDVLT